MRTLENRQNAELVKAQYEFIQRQSVAQAQLEQNIRAMLAEELKKKEEAERAGREAEERRQQEDLRNEVARIQASEITHPLLTIPNRENVDRKSE